MPYSDKKKAIEYGKRYRESANGKEVRARWLDENRAKVNASAAKWVKDHPDYYKQWCDENRAKLRAYRREYYAKNAEKMRAQAKARRQRIKSLGITNDNEKTKGEQQ